MIKVRLLEKPAFRVIGCKTWIGGVEDEAAFGRFWNACRESGMLQTLDTIRGGRSPGPVTNGIYLGVSRVEKDPNNRSFFFYVGVESEANAVGEGLEEVHVPAARWAVFEACGEMPQALVAAEMYAFTEWLPSSGYRHANAPELEVYPPHTGGEGQTLVEFWLPILPLSE